MACLQQADERASTIRVEAALGASLQANREVILQACPALKCHVSEDGDAVLLLREWSMESVMNLLKFLHQGKTTIHHEHAMEVASLARELNLAPLEMEALATMHHHVVLNATRDLKAITQHNIDMENLDVCMKFTRELAFRQLEIMKHRETYEKIYKQVSTDVLTSATSPELETDEVISSRNSLLLSKVQSSVSTLCIASKSTASRFVKRINFSNRLGAGNSNISRFISAKAYQKIHQAAGQDGSSTNSSLEAISTWPLFLSDGTRILETSLGLPTHFDIADTVLATRIFHKQLYLTSSWPGDQTVVWKSQLYSYNFETTQWIVHPKFIPDLVDVFNFTANRIYALNDKNFLLLDYQDESPSVTWQEHTMWDSGSSCNFLESMKFEQGEMICFAHYCHNELKTETTLTLYGMRDDEDSPQTLRSLLLVNWLELTTAFKSDNSIVFIMGDFRNERFSQTIVYEAERNDMKLFPVKMGSLPRISLRSLYGHLIYRDQTRALFMKYETRHGGKKTLWAYHFANRTWSRTPHLSLLNWRRLSVENWIQEASASRQGQAPATAPCLE